MKRQRGIADLWLVAIGLIAVLALLSGLVYGVTSYLEDVRAEAKKAGGDECDAAYKERDNKQLQAALSRVKQLEDEARDREARHAAELAKIGQQLKKEKNDAKEAEKRMLADIAAGKLRVREDAFQAGACPTISGGGEERAACASGSGSDGPAACKLSDQATSNLLAIGREADDVARQLAAAQAVILENLRTCGPGT